MQGRDLQFRGYAWVTVPYGLCNCKFKIEKVK